ncbi:MAG: hypothetical protein HRS57_02115, partial [Mycoplasmataceae bacterium]|nr:hypothetical protein [Mycoplasmataceae bacterium]
MNSFLLIVIILSSFMFIALVALYIKYWKDFRVIVKSTINEILGKRSKSALIS